MAGRSAAGGAIALSRVPVWIFVCAFAGSDAPAGPETIPAPQESPAPGVAGRPTYRIPRATGSIRLDGNLDDAAWSGALRLDLPYEVDPAENLPARVRTEAFLVYDASGLHVAFRAHEPEPDSIQAHLADRDNAFRDDFVGIAVDPFNDERRGFELFVNPLGVQMDLSRNDVGGEEQREDASWDAIWHSAGRLTPAGYEVEMSIPFTSLRFPRTEGEQTWGLVLLRNHPRSLRRQYGLVPFDRDKDCFFCQAAKLTGLSGITPGRNLEFDPTFVIGRTDAREDFPAGPFLKGDVDADPGLSARWSVTPNLTLNAAVNPDFSQVEADVAQLDVNTRFALFFPEKRPFFMEAADMFATPLNIVHTRTVTEPAWGAKLTGKEGPHALGVAFGRDRRTSLIFPSNQESDDDIFDLDHDVGLVRYRHDIGAGSTLGFLATGRSGEDYANTVAGVDAYLKIGDAGSLRLQALRSRTRYPDAIAADFGQPAEPFADEAFTARYLHDSRGWFIQGLLEDLGRGFRADTGFLPRVDTRKAEAIVERVIWAEPGSRFTRVAFGTWDWLVEDHDGLLTDRSLGIHMLFWGPRQSFLFARAARELEYFEGATYDKSTGEFDFNIRPAGDMVLALRGRLGDAVDYDNARAGRLFRVSPAVTLDLGRGLHFQIDHTFETLDVAGGRLYEANLSQVKAVYQFNLRTFARAIIQYQDVTRDPSLYVDPIDSSTKDVLAQFLFSYKVNPQTLIFVGYSDARSDEGADRLLREDRTFFVKLGYAWVL